MQVLCDSDILRCDDGVVSYAPSNDLEAQVGEFVEACQDRGRRLALIALVLHGIAKSPND